MGTTKVEELPYALKYGCVRCNGKLGAACIRTKPERALYARIYCRECWILEGEHDDLLTGDLRNLPKEEEERRLRRLKEIEDLWRNGRQ